MYNCEMCNTSFATKEEFFAHPHIVQKKIGDVGKRETHRTANAGYLETGQAGSAPAITAKF